MDYVVNDSVATSSRKNENLNTPCVHCGEEIPPKAKEQELETEHNPQSSSSSHLLLFCQRCGQNHHASCVDLEDPVVLSKVQDYEWHCPNVS